MKKLRNYFFISLLVILILGSILNYTSKAETDTDSDGIPDDWENEYGLDPNNASDAGQDNDGDSLTNLEEYNNGTNSTDPNNSDSDGGGVNDNVEVNYGYDPNDPVDDDTIDSDRDGMPDVWELNYTLNPNDPSDAHSDLDRDGYDNLWEFENGTNPMNANEPKEPIADGGKDDKEESDTSLTSAPICIIIIVPAIVILIVIIFFYTKMRREQLLEHKIRNDLYKYINKHPGTHYRRIMTDLDLHMGVLTHHLNMLEQMRYIKSYQDGMYRRFYPIDAQINTQLVLTDVQEKILRSISKTPGISQTGIGNNLGLSRKIVHYHIKVLSDAGFVHVETNGRETRCYYLDGLDLDSGVSGIESKEQGETPAG